MNASTAPLRPFLLLFALLAAVATLPATAQPPGEGKGPPGPCPGGVLVTITVVPDQEPLGVDPDSVDVYREPGQGRPGRVCWVVDGLAEGETLHIAGKPDSPVKDPFPKLERTITAPRNEANSGAPSKTGTWGYDLWITRKGSNKQFHFTDPEVIIHGGGPGNDEGDGGG